MASDSAPIRIRYRQNGVAVEKACDFLFVACEPRGLESVLPFTPEEAAIFAELHNFTFHTELLRVRRTTAQSCAALFAPTLLEAEVGRFHGFRNASAKQFGLDASNQLEHNYVVTYQLRGDSVSTWTDAQFREQLREDISTCTWWPFERDYEIRQTLTSPYFDHFHGDALQRGLPWTLLDLQGRHATAFVHASACFESVLHCWGYVDTIVRRLEKGVGGALPEKTAPIVILGAGPSGLLTAVQLARRGYSNVEILESTARHGGKTHTVVEPAEGSEGPTVCELGTCYASPAYDPMVADLQEFLTGNPLRDFDGGTLGYRSMVTTGQFPPEMHVPEIVDFGKYVLLKAEEEKDEVGHPDITMALLLKDLTAYGLLHRAIMGEERPMPTRQPEAPSDAFWNQTFYEFLKAHDLLSVVGLFQYSQEVQGYGSLWGIPAYYGLLWMTPAITDTILKDFIDGKLHRKGRPVVRTFAKGWGDLWDQVAADDRLKITCSVTIDAVTRSGVS